MLKRRGFFGGLAALFGAGGVALAASKDPALLTPSQDYTRLDCLGHGTLLQGEALRPWQAPVTVNITVNALDAKSFLDHSEAIAEAVQHAVRNGQAIGLREALEGN